MGVRRVGRASFTAALLLVSGAAALAHEAAWQRLWSLYAGAGVATSAAVVAGTLLGLGFGSAVGGVLADRTRRPGLVFALAELLGGAAALCVPSLVTWRVAAGAPGSVQALVEVACACALPSTFLGASLPAAVRAIEPARGRGGPLALPPLRGEHARARSWACSVRPASGSRPSGSGVRSGSRPRGRGWSRCWVSSCPPSSEAPPARAGPHAPGADPRRRAASPSPPRSQGPPRWRSRSRGCAG